jgi:cobalamin biosynthesis protein CobT
MPSIAIEVAQQLFERIEQKQVDGIAALYADDILNNFTNATQSKADNPRRSVADERRASATT